MCVCVFIFIYICIYIYIYIYIEREREREVFFILVDSWGIEFKNNCGVLVTNYVGFPSVVTTVVELNLVAKEFELMPLFLGSSYD